MKILLIGKNGQLGSEIMAKTESYGLTIKAVDLPEFDITSPASIAREVDNSDVFMVINASAYTAVDKAESESEIAFAVNTEGAANLATICAKTQKPLIHISTDYVFDGLQQAPYSVDDPVSPLGVYGMSKYQGEEQVRKVLAEHIIIRTAWLYSSHGTNFVKTMLRLGHEKEEIEVVSDQFGCPTWAADLADAVLKISCLVKDKKVTSWGTYHCCGHGVTSWHGFAQEIFSLAKQYTSLTVTNVNAIPTDAYPTPAKRPPNSSLDCSKLEEVFSVKPRSWQESLAEMVAQFFSDHETSNLK